MALTSRARIRSLTLRSAHGSEPLRSNAAPISLIRRSTAATELMCWAGAVSARKDDIIAHCEEGAVLCCSYEVGWRLTCAARYRGNEKAVHNAEGSWSMDVAPGVSSSTIEASGNLVSISRQM